MKAAQITVLVKDQAAAARFYAEVLGFAIRDDIDLGDGMRYVAVVPQEDRETAIELVQASTPAELALVGGQAGDQVLIMFETDDIARDHREMTARGVRFHDVPQAVPGGLGAGFQDLDGNQYDLFQPDRG